MRYNLNVPYAQRLEAKALGAWWDPKRKTWYVVNPADLSAFGKWIDLQEPAKAQTPPKKSRPKITGVYEPLCDCDVLPWEDCSHTEAAVERILEDQYGLAKWT